MAHLWKRDSSNQWQAVPLDTSVHELVFHAPDTQGRQRAILLNVDSGGRNGWLLLSAPAVRVRVNGLRVQGGIRWLDDRDEILLPPVHRMYFSSEHQPRIVPRPERASDGRCPRCKQKIEADDPAVECPACGVWHHQSDDLPCWTYAEVCAICGRNTDLEAGFQWTPDQV